MVKQDGQEEPTLPDPQCSRTGSDQPHLEEAVWDRNRHVGGVEAQRRTAIKVEIDVMDQVEAPKKGRPVRRHVPEVHSVVHQQESQHVPAPSRQRQLLDEPAPAALRPFGERLRQRRLQQPDRRHARRPERQVARDAPDRRLRRRAQGPAAFGEEKRQGSRTQEPPPETTSRIASDPLTRRASGCPRRVGWLELHR